MAVGMAEKRSCSAQLGLGGQRPRKDFADEVRLSSQPGAAPGHPACAVQSRDQLEPLSPTGWHWGGRGFLGERSEQPVEEPRLLQLALQELLDGQDGRRTLCFHRGLLSAGVALPSPPWSDLRAEVIAEFPTLQFNLSGAEGKGNVLSHHRRHGQKSSPPQPTRLS